MAATQTRWQGNAPDYQGWVAAMGRSYGFRASPGGAAPKIPDLIPRHHRRLL